MNMVSMSISKEGERQRYLPLEMRMQMYEDVHRLHKEGLTHKEIQRKIYEKYKEQISFCQISLWVHEKHNPFGRVNKFDNKPSLELMYVGGTIIGDGYKCFDGKGYRIELTVNDKEFAEEFGRNLAKVLGKSKPYKPYWDKTRKQWKIEVCSILLYKFLNKPLEELKPYIEYSKKTVASFLKALFDGEGSIEKRRLRLYNTSTELLNYAKYLLKKYFNINATGPHLARKSGKIMPFPNGKIIKTKKDYYYLYIRANSLLNFYKYIGFTIERKQQRLIKAIKQ